MLPIVRFGTFNNEVQRLGKRGLRGVTGKRVNKFVYVLWGVGCHDRQAEPACAFGHGGRTDCGDENIFFVKLV